MRRTHYFLSVTLSLSLLVCASAASAANKCVINGTVTFQQGPCPSDQVRKALTVKELNAQEGRRSAAMAATTPAKPGPAASGSGNGFACDGRQYCSQMKSCEEAKHFLAHCPGVKMDGDRNGIPCEKQWCGR